MESWGRGGHSKLTGLGTGIFGSRIEMDGMQSRIVCGSGAFTSVVPDLASSLQHSNLLMHPCSQSVPKVR